MWGGQGATLHFCPLEDMPLPVSARTDLFLPSWALPGKSRTAVGQPHERWSEHMEGTRPLRALSEPRSCWGWSTWGKPMLRVSQAAHGYLSPADTFSVSPAVSQSPSPISLPATFTLPWTNPSFGSSPWCICCFRLLTFRLCSHYGSWAMLIPFPFGDCQHILVLKQLPIKLEGGLKSRSSLTSTVDPPRTQPLPSCKF